jgi:hypothetical protein
MKSSHALTKALGVMALALSCAGTASATEIELGKWVEKVKVSGDFRLRQENFHFRQRTSNEGRSRQRYRLRLGLDVPLPNGMAFKSRFATGGADQVSTNQSLDDLSTKKEFRLDRAYLEWKGFGDKVKLSGGKMANPLWTQYSSDIVFDEDLSPEGFGQGVDLMVGPLKVFANAMQSVLDEDNSNKDDQWLVSTQLGAEFKLPLESRLRVAGAVHDWVNETASDFGSTTTATAPTFQTGNRKTGNKLLNDFHVWELTGAYSFWVKSIPVVAQGTYITNTASKDSLTPSADSGQQVGVILGKASNAKSMEIAYFYKRSATDATVASVADSDLGEGGANRRAHIAWLAYNLQEWWQVKAKYFITRLDDTAFNTNKPDDVNRLQVDMSVKF